MRKKALSWILTVAMVLSFFVTMPTTVNAQPPDYNCQIVETGVEYASFDQAVAAAESEQTIRLLTNINYTSSLYVESKSIIFDLNGFTLNLSSTEDWGHGLEVGLGGAISIDDSQGGELNIFGNNASTKYGTGIYIHDGGSAVVTNITSYGYANGADCTGGYLLVKGDVNSGGNGVFGQTGAHIILEGDIFSGGMGAIAGWEETLIEIKGNVNANNGLGLSVSAGTVKVTGNVQSNNFGGVSVSFDGTAEIKGNVTGSDFGAQVNNAGNISIDGDITSAQYILLNDILISADDFSINGNGYYIYTDETNLVQVKIKTCLIDGCSTSLEDGGFTQYSVIDDEIYYHVTNAEQLAHMNNHLDLNYIQMNDIDLTGIDWSPIGLTYDTPFRGIYDGNHHSITNLDVNQNAVNTNKSGGLFGALKGASVVKNLNVSGNVSYSVVYYASSSLAGGIAASMFSDNGERPIIDNCSFTGDVTATAESNNLNNNIGAHAGGIVGYARDGIIQNCHYEGGSVISTTIPYGINVNIRSNAGGIAGNLNEDASIINCYTSSHSNISATGGYLNNAGGIAGQLQYNSTISVSYNVGTIDAYTDKIDGIVNVGGILGHSEGANTISDSYWLDSCGADNQVGNDDSTSANGKIAEVDMKSTNFKNTLNTALNTVADTTLLIWDQNIGNYPTLSSVLWEAPVPSGGGSSYTAPTIVIITEEKNNSTVNSTELSPATTSGTTSATVSTAIVEALLDKISSDGGALKNDRIDLVVDTTAGTKELKVDILQADLAKIIDKTDASLSITSPFISIVFDEKALNAISSAESGGRVVISAGIVDNDSLTEADKAKTQGRPVYDLSVMNGDAQVSHFNGGHATVTIPYELQAGENPNAVVIYYLSDDGKLIAVKGRYDADLKAVVFKTTHFSNFVIGYNLISFTDVAADAWYKNAIDFIAAREITSGTGEGVFSPETKLTRGQFIVLLMNAYGISADTADEEITNFVDAGNTYYTDYLLAAKAHGIVNGVGNNMFAPEQAITRQEMFVMLYNALDVIEELPQTYGDKQLSDFEDVNQVASWAQEAMGSLIEGGVISGSNGMLNPTESTTRAEMAQMLYNLLSK